MRAIIIPAVIGTIGLEGKLLLQQSNNDTDSEEFEA